MHRGRKMSWILLFNDDVVQSAYTRRGAIPRHVDAPKRVCLQEIPT